VRVRTGPVRWVEVTDKPGTLNVSTCLSSKFLAAFLGIGAMLLGVLYRCPSLLCPQLPKPMAQEVSWFQVRWHGWRRWHAGAAAW